MNRLEINLLRDRVPSPARRRLLHVALMAYLVFSGLLLVWVANLSARRLIDADYHRRDCDRIARSLAEQYPGDATADATLARLKSRANASAAALGAVEQVAAQRVLLARLLLGLRHPIPENLLLVDLAYEREGRAVQFGVSAREERDPAALSNSGDLTARWAADPLLAAQLHDIKPVRTERTRRDGREVMVERYTATVGDKGGGDHGPGPVSP